MKVLKLSSCMLCPYSDTDHYEFDGRCVGLFCSYGDLIEHIPDPYKIPEWCPLEDYKENDPS